MDHHCPWVNNCVGYYTQKHFILFLYYVFAGSSHALFVIFRMGIYCLDKNCAVFQPVSNMILSNNHIQLTHSSHNCYLLGSSILPLCLNHVL